MKRETKPHEQCAQALAQALKASRRGDLGAAQHWSRVADQMSRAAERLAANPAPVDPGSPEDEERMLEELRERFARFAKCDIEIGNWEAEREAYQAAVAEAQRTGGPMPEPLRAAPAGPDDLSRIARGEA